MDSDARANSTMPEFEALKEADLSVAHHALRRHCCRHPADVPHHPFHQDAEERRPVARHPFRCHHEAAHPPARYREGVIAQFFYVGAQIMCWTFIIQYGTHYFMLEGMDERSAEVLSQRYNIYAMVLFCCSRFICTFILRYLNPGQLLMILAICAGFFTLGVIGLENRYGVYCLVGVSGCMSLMFPTIYGIASKAGR